MDDSPKPVARVHVKSLQDLDRQHFIKALPKSRKALNRIAKMCPTDAETLGPNERWVMADSGSTLHAMDVQKELPNYKHLVAPFAEICCAYFGILDKPFDTHVDQRLYFKHESVTSMTLTLF